MISISVTFSSINIRSATFGVKLGVLFAAAKLIALSFIIITGIWYAAMGHIDNFKDPWENTTTNPGSIALATVNAYFAYTGWYANVRRIKTLVI